MTGFTPPTGPADPQPAVFTSDWVLLQNYEDDGGVRPEMWGHTKLPINLFWWPESGWSAANREFDNIVRGVKGRDEAMKLSVERLLQLWGENPDAQ